MFLPHNPLLWMSLTHMVNLSNINQCSFTLIQCCSKTISKPWAGHIHSIGLTNKMCFHFHFTLLASSIDWVYKGRKVGSELEIFVHLKYLFRKTFVTVFTELSLCTLNVLCESMTNTCHVGAKVEHDLRCIEALEACHVNVPLVELKRMLNGCLPALCRVEHIRKLFFLLTWPGLIVHFIVEL